jgi:hypothetical protein
MDSIKLPIQNIMLIENNHEYIDIRFSTDWYQENINDLIELLFDPIMPLNIQERIIGADRVNVRFEWQQHHFVVNFEFYSQSCWIEGQDELSKQYLLTLYEMLNK